MNLFRKIQTAYPRFNERREKLNIQMRILEDDIAENDGEPTKRLINRHQRIIRDINANVDEFVPYYILIVGLAMPETVLHEFLTTAPKTPVQTLAEQVRHVIMQKYVRGKISPVKILLSAIKDFDTKIQLLLAVYLFNADLSNDLDKCRKEIMETADVLRNIDDANPKLFEKDLETYANRFFSANRDLYKTLTGQAYGFPLEFNAVDPDAAHKAALAKHVREVQLKMAKKAEAEAEALADKGVVTPDETINNADAQATTEPVVVADRNIVSGLAFDYDFTPQQVSELAEKPEELHACVAEPVPARPFKLKMPPVKATPKEFSESFDDGMQDGDLGWTGVPPVVNGSNVDH